MSIEAQKLELMDQYTAKLLEAEAIEGQYRLLTAEENGILPDEGGGGQTIVNGVIVCPYDCDSCHSEDCPCDRIGCAGDGYKEAVNEQ